MDMQVRHEPVRELPSVIGIDYGTVKVGIAYAENGVVFPHSICTPATFVSTVKSLSQEKKIDTIVFGVPRSLSGRPNPLEQQIRQLPEKHFSEFAVDFVDEKFSSKAVGSSSAVARDDLAAAQIIEYWYEVI